MPAWPRGPVTFLCTDIEGSTILWERDWQAIAIAADCHLAQLNEATAAHDGGDFKTFGDAIQVLRITSEPNRGGTPKSTYVWRKKIQQEDAVEAARPRQSRV